MVRNVAVEACRTGLMGMAGNKVQPPPTPRLRMGMAGAKARRAVATPVHACGGARVGRYTAPAVQLPPMFLSSSRCFAPRYFAVAGQGG